jgi:hypothetical protein
MPQRVPETVSFLSPNKLPGMDRVVDSYAVRIRPVNGSLDTKKSHRPVTKQWLLLVLWSLHFKIVPYNFSIVIRHQAGMQIPKNIHTFWSNG